MSEIPQNYREDRGSQMRTNTGTFSPDIWHFDYTIEFLLISMSPNAYLSWLFISVESHSLSKLI